MTDTTHEAKSEFACSVTFTSAQSRLDFFGLVLPLIAKCSKRSSERLITGESANEVTLSARDYAESLYADPAWADCEDYWWNLSLYKGAGAGTFRGLFGPPVAEDETRICWESRGTKGRMVGVRFSADVAMFFWRTMVPGRPSAYLQDMGVYAASHLLVQAHQAVITHAKERD